MKDLPSEINPGLVIAGYPPRDSPHDALVARGEALGVHGLPRGARVGTSSVRRRAFLLNLRSDLEVDVARGNVDTRLRKLLNGVYDALVLAEAGLVRLIRDGMEIPVGYSRIPLDELPPAPGQGIVAVVARRDNKEIIRILERASDPVTRAQALAERAFLASVGGGCHVPLGGVAIGDDELEFIAGIASLDGKAKVVVRLRGSLESPEELGRRAAEVLIKEGGDVLRNLGRGRGPSVGV
jgi:hydroxymethylbilane synthase